MAGDDQDVSDDQLDADDLGGTYQRGGHTPQSESGFNIAGAPSETVEQIVGDAQDDPLYYSRLAAEQDRMMELHDLESRVMQYWIDYRWVLLAGVPGVLIFFGSLAVERIDKALGAPLGPHTSWVRFGMMLVGAYLIFAGWPRRTRRGETVAQDDAVQEAMRRARAEFHRRLRR